MVGKMSHLTFRMYTVCIRPTRWQPNQTEWYKEQIFKELPQAGQTPFLVKPQSPHCSYNEVNEQTWESYLGHISMCFARVKCVAEIHVYMFFNP